MPSPTVQYQYANGSSNSTRLTGVTYPNGRAVNYGYGSSGDVNDAASRVTAIQSGAGATPLASYEYLGLGAVARVNYPEPSIENVLADGSGNNPNTGDIYTGLDQFGRIIDCLWRQYSTSPATDIERVKYTYDRVGNRLTRQNAVAATTSNNFWDEKYTYDALYRLTDAKRGTLSSGSISPLKFEQSWTLDATGNWSQFNQDDTGDGTWDLQQTRAASKVNAITNIGATTGPTWATPAYDAAGNMTTIPKTDAPTTTYTAKYDAWNRLVKLTDSASSNTVQENAYDGRGYRTIRKTYTAGTLSETRHFYYSENWQCVEERLGTSPSTASPNRHFVWGVRYIDDLILRDRSTTGTLNERLYAQQDANWNITTVCASNGTVQQRMAYQCYGIDTTLNASFSPSTSTIQWERRFAGYLLDLAPSQYLVRNRTYQQLIGSWGMRDPTTIGSDINFYLYALSRPLVFIDPLGLEPPQNCIRPEPDPKFSSTPQVRRYVRGKKYIDIVSSAPDVEPPKSSSAYSIISNNLRELLEGATREQQNIGVCIRSLEFSGHGSPTSQRIGTAKDTRGLPCSRITKSSLLDNAITADNAAFVGRSLSTLSLCCPCFIYLSGCNTGNAKSPNGAAQQLADNTGCYVITTRGSATGTFLGGDISVFPGKEPLPETTKQFGSSSSRQINFPRDKRQCESLQNVLPPDQAFGNLPSGKSLQSLIKESAG